jgi:hypothetical protein
LYAEAVPRLTIIVVAGVLAVGIAQQLLIPSLAEDHEADRLERFGGDASVELSAFPALRLLWDDGESIHVSGGGLRLDLEDEEIDAFERLDGFDEVRLALTDVEAGPIAVDSFDLRRGEDDDTYTMGLECETSPREVASYLGGQAGGTLGSLLGDAFAGAVPASGTPVPLRLEAEINSEDGHAEADEASGSVAGIPAGPLAVLVANAVVRRL